MSASSNFGTSRLLTGLAMMVTAAGIANAADLLQRPGPSFHMEPLAEDWSPAAQSGEVEVFVRLAAPSVAAYCVIETLAGRPIPSAAMQKAHASSVDAAQMRISAQLAALGVKELSRLRVGDNGFRVRVDASRVDELRNIIGVTAVAKVTLHTPDLARSVPWIGADTVQAGRVDGTGVTIAVIDTGADYNHANLGGSGIAADFAANDPNIIEPGSFPTAKVTGGFDFAGPVYDAGVPALSTPIPDPDPLDGDGHGSHVTGIASGLGVPGVIGVGVAPGASILALKVFGDVAGMTALVSDAIEVALDPNGDGDTSDHVDVINMSLGSGFGSPDDPSAVASQNASDLGIIVVASAGNSGTIPYITGSPAVAGDAISVASSFSGGDTLGVLVSGDVNDTFEAVEGAGAVRLSDGSVTGDLMAPSDPANVLGCDPIADDLTGKVALISRGDCSFDLKYINAQAAGADAILVYNDGTSADRIAPIVMSGVGDSGFPITIPGVMTTAFDGSDLSSALAGGASITSTLDESIVTATLFGDTISSFSSQGPGHGGSTFKPDVTAPGSAIVSTGASSGTGPLTLNGTSMASPHVAGLAALLRQVHPGLQPTAIKAIIQNSAVTAAGAGTVGPTPALSRQGTGVVRADRAIGLSSYAAPGGVSFGRINPSKPKKFKESFRIHDLSGGSRHFTGTHVANQTFPGVEVSCPSSASTDHGNSGKLQIKLAMDPTVGPYDDAFHSQTEVDGWCVFDDGVDTLRVGYLAVVDPASDMKAKGKGGVVKIENDKGNVGWAEGFTLAGRDGLMLDGTTNSFNAVGVRTNFSAAFGDLVEFGISSDRTWETMAPFEIDIFVDVDADGADDFALVAALFPGDEVPITAIFPFPFNRGSTLFDVGQDFNDASAILTFIGAQEPPFGFLGFLPPGDTDFDYAAFFFGRDGSFDVQIGSVDLADEIVPAFNSFGLAAGTEFDVPVSGSGEMLWLFQNNEAKNRKGKHQADIVRVSADSDDSDNDSDD